MSDGAEKFLEAQVCRRGGASNRRNEWRRRFGASSPALLVRQCAYLQQPSPPSCTHDADARSEDSHRVRCTGRENIGQHAVRKEEACGYLLRRTDGDMRRGLGWQRETSVQHLWASVDAPRTILIAACFFKAHFGLTVK